MAGTASYGTPAHITTLLDNFNHKAIIWSADSFCLIVVAEHAQKNIFK